jgi:hypothetical protein
MKYIEFKVRMPIRDDQDPQDAASDLLSLGEFGVEPGVEIVAGSLHEVQVSTPGSYKLARGSVPNTTGEASEKAIRRIRGGD